MSHNHAIAVSLRRIAPLFGVAVALAITWWILVGPILGSDPWASFRLYFSNDQLSYARIATNVAEGNPWFVEPFTLTGTSYYPSASYILLGLLSAVTGLSVSSAWTIFGLAIVSATVVFFSVAAWKLSGWWWATLLPAVALTAGTSASLLQGPSFEGYWQTRLDHHAVLWGPFATFFTLNAEVAGMCIAACAFLVLLLATLPGARRPYPLLMLSALLVGVTANVHSYAFLTAAFLFAAWGVILLLLKSRSRALTLLTVSVLAASLILGPLAAEHLGQLWSYALLFLAVIPVLVYLAGMNARALFAAVIPLALFASPQLVRTGIGIIQGDQFLTYREASTENLGVPIIQGLAAAAIPILVWLACFIAPRIVYQVRAPLVALAVASVVLVSNNLWGFDQEPYRFWLELNTISLLLLSVLAPMVFAPLVRIRSQYPRRLPASLILLTMAGSLYVTGIGDVMGFWDYAKRQGSIPSDPQPGSRFAELASIGDALNAQEPTPGFVGTDPCIDPRQLALFTSVPIADYNLGMAWPEDFGPMNLWIQARKAGEFQAPTAQNADVAVLITDTTCQTRWQPRPDSGFTPSASVGRFLVWQRSSSSP